MFLFYTPNHTKNITHTKGPEYLLFKCTYSINQACSTFWYLKVSMFCYLVIIWLIILENLNTFIYSFFGDFIFSQPVLYCNFWITLPSSYLLNEIQYLFPTKFGELFLNVVYFSLAHFWFYSIFCFWKTTRWLRSYALITRKLPQLYYSYIFLSHVTIICSILSFNVILKTLFYAWFLLFSTSTFQIVS